VQHSVGPGTFLIASPTLRDPNFSRTVVLVCEHDDEEGSMGLVVNRPLDTTLDQALADLAPRPRQALFYGGPVQRDIVLVLHHAADIDGARAICDGMELGGEAEQILDLLRGPRHAQARVFSGYSGWGAGQLRAELKSGSWITCPASARFVFEVDPGALWEEILRSLGPRYAYLTTVPIDPRVN
jgi:putative transcriptional regulator